MALLPVTNRYTFLLMRSRIRRLERLYEDPIAAPSEAELDAGIAAYWSALCNGEAPVGDDEGLIAYLVEHCDEDPHGDFATELRHLSAQAKQLK